MQTMRRIVVFGVFDILHPGHLYFLRQAKKHGLHLTVVVTRDARVYAEKKRRPFFNEQERLEIVRALRNVDRVVLGDRTGEWNVLKHLRPDVVCIGYDQQAKSIDKCGLRKLPKLVRLKRYKKYSALALRGIR